MCFYHDYEWYAGVCEVTQKIAQASKKCQECGEVIQVGEQYWNVYQQEAEACLACESGNCDCIDCCQCESPNIGETYETWYCDNCRLFRECIREAEEAEGCRGAEAEPSYEGMLEEIRNGDEDNARRYFKTALKKYPQLKTSGYLGRLWNRMFV